MSIPDHSDCHRPARTMNVGVLASHEGTTLQSLFDAFSGGRIQGRVAVVVSNNGDSGALRRARQACVQAVHLSSKTHEDPAALDAAIRGVLVAADVDVVFLAGYMKKLGPLAYSGLSRAESSTLTLPSCRDSADRGCMGIGCSRQCWRPRGCNWCSIHLVDADYDDRRHQCVSAGCRCFGAIPSTI